MGSGIFLRFGCNLKSLRKYQYILHFPSNGTCCWPYFCLFFQQLYLTQNNINFTHHYAFRGLKTLHTSDMSNNQLISAPYLAEAKFTLRVLDLEWNSIKHIEDSNFKSFISIMEIAFLMPTSCIEIAFQNLKTWICNIIKSGYFVLPQETLHHDYIPYICNQTNYQVYSFLMTHNGKHLMLCSRITPCIVMASWVGHSSARNKIGAAISWSAWGGCFYGVWCVTAHLKCKASHPRVQVTELVSVDKGNAHKT